MALAPGTRLGPYEITAQIGVGGMGEALLSFAVVFCRDDENIVIAAETCSRLRLVWKLILVGFIALAAGISDPVC